MTTGTGRHTEAAPRPSISLGRLGAAVVLGAVAGYGAHRVLSRASRSLEYAGPVDWALAKRLALRTSAWERMRLSDRAARQAQYSRFVQACEPLLTDYLGAHLPQPVKAIRVVDRREWLELNFRSFQALLEPFEALYERLQIGGKLGGAAGGKLAGAQLGIVLGFLARQVLGQYDLSLLSPDPEVRGSLYFVEPNIVQVQKQLGLPDEDFRLWITLHELTHVFQFEAYPWLRPVFRELLEAFIEEAEGRLTQGARLPEMLERLALGQGHWSERLLSPVERALFHKLQALMSLVEGYSNHVMHAVGKDLIPALERIETRIQRRRQNRPPLVELFDRLTGLQLKRAQYRQGEAFVEAIVEARGIDFMNRVWEGPEYLPTLAEIQAPGRWITRMSG